ncbi:hypothetical protein GGI20_004050 [Coemansia sp. BCRC 34301]|nr:hypothetical protein GGI20_004050 [Coemansia sp. BCRC 34301]
MYCRRCGEIVVNGEATCKKCGGRAVESTTGAGAMNTTHNERKDPWTSKYVQRRLNPANINKGVAAVAAPRPTSTVFTSSFDSGHGSSDLLEYPRGGSDAADVLGLLRPRGIIRDAASRPASMHAAQPSLGGSPVMAAAQKSVSGSPVAVRGLKSKWSQYFTSTATSPETEKGGSSGGPRVRSESLSAPVVASNHVLRPTHSSNLSADHRQPLPPPPPPPPRMAAGSAAAMRGTVGSPMIGSALAVERSRSATLPDHGGSRACTTCGIELRAEEQRQFATQPGLVYCTRCYHSSYSRGSCAGCAKVVLTHGRPWAQYGDRVWHKLCIRCRSCNRLLAAPLVGADGEPSCEPCFALATADKPTEPPVPSAIGGSTVCPRPASPVSSVSDSLGALRIMSPVEVAAHQGLPPPPAIVDPDSPAAPAEAPPSTVSAPASRTASPRSVSFRTEPDEIKVNEPDTAPKSLADYVLSKASTASSPRAKLGPMVSVSSVADTVKRLAAAGSQKSTARPSPPAAAAAAAAPLPDLRDLIRTHQRQAPTDPTVPALDRHSHILKSRPRNTNRRHQSTAASPEQEESPVVVPNTCARCERAIEDTWFRLSDGRQVHVECFSCQTCGALIDDGVYVLDNGVEFHPQCVPPAPPPRVTVDPEPLGRIRGPRAPRREEACDRCHQPLAGPRFQLTNGKQYHPQCFACAGCHQRFDEGSYVCFEGNEYHHHCVDQVAQPAPTNNRQPDLLPCAQCHAPIEGVFLRHNDAVFHPPCFCCTDCRRPITPGMAFGEVDARPCCEECLSRRATTSPANHPRLNQLNSVPTR